MVLSLLLGNVDDNDNDNDNHNDNDNDNYNDNDNNNNNIHRLSVNSSILGFRRHLRQNVNRRSCQELVPTQRTAAYTNVTQI